MNEKLDERSGMRRIHAAFCEMPYGGIAHFAHRSLTEMTLDDVADNLEKLRDVLQGVAERQNEQDAELAEINAEMRTVKSFFARFQN